MSRNRRELPVDAILPAVRAGLEAARAVVVTAPPGSGKTTRVPPALTPNGSVLLVQPRRVAARSVARRIAFEAGCKVGDEVGWQVRFERKFSKRTKLLVVTEGILLARLQDDPFLTDFQTLVLDEIHERSAQMDLGFALARQVLAARDDFRVVVMSATLDADLYSGALGGCPIVRAEARLHPVEVEYRDGVAPADAVREAFSVGDGHLLCFLPGMADIDRTARALEGGVPGARIHRLHGSLSPEEQDAALAGSRERKVILATNVAETSITVDGVTTVVDSGLQKVMRQDRRIGLDRLSTERIAADSAEQRAGRAGRTRPGRAVRLWHPAQQLRPAREPEIHRIDLAPILLELLAWSEDPRTFAWLERPAAEALEAGLTLLESLGATRRGVLVDIGRTMRRLPMPPRLARVLIEAGGGRRAAELCAGLSDPASVPRGIAATTASDVLSRLADFSRAPFAVRRAAEQIERVADRILPARHSPGEVSDDELRRALLAGFADRLARRRAPGSDRLVLANGHGARLANESGVRDGEWLVAIALRAAQRGTGAEALVEVASRVEKEWLPLPEERVEHEFDSRQGRVRAFRRRRIGTLLVEERAAEVDPDAALSLLRDAFAARKPSAPERQLQTRADIAGVELDLNALVEASLMGATSLPKIDFHAMLPHAVRKALDRHAPETLEVPSGCRHRLEYRDDGEIVLAVKLQELFGLADSPQVGNPARAITLSLLAPNGRPVQTTRDLRNFWEQTYPEVRKEMRGRYAKHPWPEDPWTAPPTARTKRRSRLS
ncbi:MAG: ATP-dependent helicase HrpB [Candidatus Binatia bacterium]|nr:ATP-dependent helicase HrpB [Candidatus Binatia bacterium]